MFIYNPNFDIFKIVDDRKLPNYLLLATKLHYLLFTIELLKLCIILHSHNSSAEDSSLLGCNMVLGK